MEIARPRPSWTELYLRCGKCETRWLDWQPVGCKVDVWIATIKLLSCPKCGAGAEAIFVPAGAE
jgi:ribosomal protein S27AE